MKHCNCHKVDDDRSVLFPEYRLLHSLWVRWWNITDELSDNHFAQRPFLEDSSIEVPFFSEDKALLKREHQLEMEKEEVIKAIEEETNRINQEKVINRQPPIQAHFAY